MKRKAKDRCATAAFVPSRKVSHRGDVLGEGEGSSAEANDAAAAAGLGHVDVVVRVGLKAGVVDLHMEEGIETTPSDDILTTTTATTKRKAWSLPSSSRLGLHMG